MQACSASSFKIEKTFESLTTKYSLFCEKRYLKEWGLFLTFLVGSIISFTVVLFEDNFGRKNVFKISYILAVVAIIFMFLVDSIHFKIVGNILIWAFHQVVDTTIFVLINELTVGGVRKRANAVLSFTWFGGGMLGNALTQYLDSYAKLYMFVMIGFFLCLPLLIWLIPQSPYLSLKLGKIEDFKESIRFTCRTNKIDPVDQQEIDLMVSELTKSTFFN